MRSWSTSSASIGSADSWPGPTDGEDDPPPTKLRLNSSIALRTAFSVSSPNSRVSRIVARMLPSRRRCSRSSLSNRRTSSTGRSSLPRVVSDQPAGAREDGEALLLHRVRRVLPLLEELHQAGPAGQLGSGGGVEV